MGPAIEKGMTIETFENIHVYPFVCELLEIEPYRDQPDSPEGNLEILSPILREPGR